MTMFCNYGHGLVPGIGSLDNFYARQHEDGEICREINRRTGQDYADWRNLEQKPLFSRSGWNVAQPGLPSDRNTAVEYRGRTVPQPAPVLTLDGLNHPILAWAELESLRVTGDRERVAADVALNHLDLMNRVFQETGTIWENYAPDAALPGRPGKKDFVGWSGLGPILFLIEYAIGLKPDAAKNELVWEVRSAQRVGCERYRFNGHLVSLICKPLAGDAPQRKLSVESDGPFTLVLQRSGHRTTYTVTRGRREFLLPGE